MTMKLSIECQDDHALFIIKQQEAEFFFPLTLEDTQHLLVRVQEVIGQVQWNIATWLFAVDGQQIYKNGIHLLPKTGDAKDQQAICGTTPPKEGWSLVPVTEEPTEHIGICFNCFALYQKNLQSRKGYTYDEKSQH
jgi:diadenosine tetraphosphate (Ap4A) HIT family hydrolase